MELLNTCFETTSDLRSIATYSHLVPLAISFFISIFAFFKSKFSRLSSVFLIFVTLFNLWLFFDWIVWTSDNYHHVAFFWSFLDYLDVAFFLFGLYFYLMLVRGQDITLLEKVFLIALYIPAFYITASHTSLLSFSQSVCEAVENGWFTSYKLFAEITSIAILLVTFVIGWRRNRDSKARGRLISVTLGLLLFFVFFSTTEYIASVTNIYEISLYGLFVLPFFLILMIISMINFQLFDLRVLSIQTLVYVLLIVIASQFLILENPNDRFLNGFTFVIALIVGIYLIKMIQKEAQARQRIERLVEDLEHANSRLQLLDRQKSEFVSIASHQLRGPLTAITGYISLLLEGDFGTMPQKVREIVEKIFQSSRSLVLIVSDFLDISRIEQGRMTYDFKDFNLKELVETVISEFQPNVMKTDLSLTLLPPQDTSYMVHADMGKVKQVLGNLIDNAIKYTPKGSIVVSLQRDNGMVRIKIQDSGVGMSKETLLHLFEKFTRAKNASAVNVVGTGLGLFVARELIKAHGGRVWAESEGEGKGSQFYIELKGL